MKALTPLCFFVVFGLAAGCDSNPVGPEEPATRTIEIDEILPVYTPASAADIKVTVDSGIAIAAKDTSTSG